MSTITIHLPKEIAHYEGDLRYFMDSMVRKLHVSRHKGFGENVSLGQLLDMATEERKELNDALSDESQMSAYFEAVDTANMFFLIGLVLSRMTKAEYVAEQENRGRN